LAFLGFIDSYEMRDTAEIRSVGRFEPYFAFFFWSEVKVFDACMFRNPMVRELQIEHVMRHVPFSP